MALSLGIATGCLIAAARLQQATSAAMLPFEASEEIVEIRLPDGAMRVDDRVMESGLFEAAGSLFIGEAEVRLASRAARSRVGVVTAGLFEVLRVRHIAGRGLSSDDEMTGAERVAVLGRRYAQRHLSDPAGALGAFVTIDGRRYRVVGVVPDALDAFGRPDVLVPQRGTRGRVVEAVASAREIAFAGVLARLYPPHTAGSAQAYFSRTSATQGISAAEFRVVPLAEALFGPVAHQVRAVLLLLLLAVAVGVSGFWIIYGGRFLMGLRHLAIRVALGAGQRRIPNDWTWSHCRSRQTV